MRKDDVASAGLDLKRRGGEVRPRGVRRDKPGALAADDCCEGAVVARVHRELAAVVFERVREDDAGEERKGRDAVRVHAVNVPAAVRRLRLHVPAALKVCDCRRRGAPGQRGVEGRAELQADRRGDGLRKARGDLAGAGHTDAPGTEQSLWGRRRPRGRQPQGG